MKNKEEKYWELRLEWRGAKVYKFRGKISKKILLILWKNILKREDKQYRRMLLDRDWITLFARKYVNGRYAPYEVRFRINRRKNIYNLKKIKFPDLDKVIKAAERWIRCEFLFRYGGQAYSDKTQKWYMSAEEELRKVVTGSTDLVRAAKIIGTNDMARMEKRKG